MTKAVPKQSVFRLHPLTYLVAVVSLSALLFANLFGSFRGPPPLSTHPLLFVTLPSTWDHGWPVCYLERPNTFPYSLTEEEVPSDQFSSSNINNDSVMSWRLPIDQAPQTFHPRGLIINTIIAILIVCCSAFVTEFYHRRYPVQWQFSLRSLLLTVTAISVLMALFDPLNIPWDSLVCGVIFFSQCLVPITLAIIACWIFRLWRRPVGLQE